MKKVITIIALTILPIIIVAAILINNKEKLENRLIDDRISFYPVTVEKAESINYHDELNIVGKTEAYRDIELISETAGKVESLYADCGTHLTKGSLIARINADLAKADFSLAEAALVKAEKDLNRFENLYIEGNISDTEIESARLNLADIKAKFAGAKKQLEDKEIISPINGVLTSRFINTGSTLAPGFVVANIIDISQLKVKVSVSEKDILKIDEHSSVRITSPLYPRKLFTGTVTSAGIKADEASTYPVEILMENKNEILKAGMLVGVKFEFSHEDNVIVIPRTSLIGSIKSPSVYIVQNNIAILRKIMAGDVMGDEVIVINGLAEGELVVTSGQNNLYNNAKVEIK